jgi:hypothetical protein
MFSSVAVVLACGCGSTSNATYDSTATFQCIENHSGKVDTAGADYIALEAAGYALVTLPSRTRLNISFWPTGPQQHDAVSQYNAVGGSLEQARNVLLVWDGVPSVRDRLTIKRCLLAPIRTTRATSAQRRVIAKLIQADSRDIAHPARVLVRAVRLSGHNPSFALATITDKQVGGATVLLHEFGRKWRILSLGSALTACSLPNQVAVDLSR